MCSLFCTFVSLVHSSVVTVLYICVPCTLQCVHCSVHLCPLYTPVCSLFCTFVPLVHSSVFTVLYICVPCTLQCVYVVFYEYHSIVHSQCRVLFSVSVNFHRTKCNKLINRWLWQSHVQLIRPCLKTHLYSLFVTTGCRFN